jgi:hypothetical protein
MTTRAGSRLPLLKNSPRIPHAVQRIGQFALVDPDRGPPAAELERRDLPGLNAAFDRAPAERQALRLWGAQIQFRQAVQDWVKSVNFARSLRGWVRLTSTPQI